MPKNGGAPGGTVKDTETVPASGEVTFSGLSDNARHVVYASVGGQPRYIEFTTGIFDKLSYHDTGGAVQETDFTAFGRSLLDDVDAAEARTTIGAPAAANPALTGTLTFNGDTNLYRSALTVLKTDGAFNATLDIVACVGTSREVTIGTSFFASVLFGGDTQIWRSAADTLTADGLIGQGGLATKTKAGIPSDSDLVAGMQQSGAFILDTTNSRIYFRVGSTWKYAALT